MAYYHSQNNLSPSVKKLNSVNSNSNTNVKYTTSHTNESGASKQPKKSISSIHTFFNKVEDNDMDRKLSKEISPKKPKKSKQENKDTNNNNSSRQNKNSENKKVKSKSTNKEESKPKKIVVVKRNEKKNIEQEDPKQKEQAEPKQETKRSSKEEQKKEEETSDMYAGGGYVKSPNPKQFSKPNIISPAKKENKSSDVPASSGEAVTHLQPQSLKTRFNHSMSEPVLVSSQSNSMSMQNMPLNYMVPNHYVNPHQIPMGYVLPSYPSMNYPMNYPMNYQPYPVMTREKPNTNTF